MLQQDEMVMVMMVVLVVEMMMMIPMKSNSMVMTMAMVSPSRREFPRQICSLQESFSLFVVFRPVEAVEYFSGRSPPTLVSCGEDIRERDPSEVGQGRQTLPRRGQTGARAW